MPVVHPSDTPDNGNVLWLCCGLLAGKLIRYLVAQGSHVQAHQPYAEVGGTRTARNHPCELPSSNLKCTTSSAEKRLCSCQLLPSVQLAFSQASCSLLPECVVCLCPMLLLSTHPPVTAPLCLRHSVSLHPAHSSSHALQSCTSCPPDCSCTSGGGHEDDDAPAGPCCGGGQLHGA